EHAEEPIEQAGEAREAEREDRRLRSAGARHVDRDGLDTLERRTEGREQLERGTDPVQHQEGRAPPLDRHTDAEAIRLRERGQGHSFSCVARYRAVWWT